MEEAPTGDIVVLAGIEEVTIGDTICNRDTPKALKRMTVEEPTVSMRFSRNTSPLAGKEGRFVQSSKIRERLFKETLRNVAIRVEEAADREGFVVKGRGEFQMAIIVETMRREGFELCVGRPEVIFREKDGERLEPIEHLFVDCEEVFLGIVTEKLSIRRGRMANLVNHGSGRVRVEFSVPSRALIGYRDEFLTDTKGTGIMNSFLTGYEQYRGDFPSRRTGSLVADRAGRAVAYALFNLEPRGTLFVVPGRPGLRGHDRRRAQPRQRPRRQSHQAEEAHQHARREQGRERDPHPCARVTLESAIQFIREDELVEVTPSSIRLRKTILPAREREITRKRG